MSALPPEVAAALAALADGTATITASVVTTTGADEQNQTHTAFSAGRTRIYRGGQNAKTAAYAWAHRRALATSADRRLAPACIAGRQHAGRGTSRARRSSRSTRRTASRSAGSGSKPGSEPSGEDPPARPLDRRAPTGGADGRAQGWTRGAAMDPSPAGRVSSCRRASRGVVA